MVIKFGGLGPKRCFSHHSGLKLCGIAIRTFPTKFSGYTVRKFEVVSDYIDIVTNLSKSGAITYLKLEGIILLVSKLIKGGTPPELKLKNPNLC